MLERLKAIEADYAALEASLASPDVLGDQRKLKEASRRYKQQTPLVECIRRYRDALDTVEAAKELLQDAQGTEREQLQQELDSATESIGSLEEELKVLLLPPDPNDGKNIIVEIRGAEGGEEANLFARDLFDMYNAYAVRNGWSVEVLSLDTSPMGGINQATMVMKGDSVWTKLRFEGGPHRVQRVPVTESQGRIHTSSATVLVLPEAEEVDFELDMNAVRKDTFRASGAGGQHRNKHQNSCRITHVPSGIVATAQCRSRQNSYDEAMSSINQRVGDLESSRRNGEVASDRKQQVGSGMRGDKIRTYRLQDDVVKDHRTDVETSDVEGVLEDGEIDKFIEAEKNISTQL